MLLTGTSLWRQPASYFHLCFKKDLNREQRKPVVPWLMLSNSGLPNYNLWGVKSTF